MVKNIIINAKGNITFESEVGKGTTFIVTLPL
ncbi:MAG: HAMP domain-containing histidine kinase [Bacteroidales bacterium]|nr:HAMP domain-containing histidine kinase [Bacteroidales bacterium]